MRWLNAFMGFAAPVFLILSPVLSYSDQAISMHKNKSSSGFSLDIPLIMLVASLLRYVGGRDPKAPSIPSPEAKQ
jgi:solute carrier family 66, member 2